ncbi:glycine receptor subunit alpha-4-like [Branchiostoma lanceolatum]|uniref:glycine receptor subunit alpha-4-like n=1 Tax=Branchiostoma lanceolatum TaxID=7740 RepID=UPI00345547C7
MVMGTLRAAGRRTVLMLCALLVGCLHRQAAAADNMTELMETLLGEQPRNLRPNFDGPPVEVIANVYISSMDSVEEKTMDYTVGIYLRQFWRDPRLVFEGLNKTISLDSNIRPKIWVPDLFFVNEKDGKMHAITTANKYIRIHPNGTVLYSMRLSLKLSCYMHLRSFPADKQYCKMQIESYSYTTQDMVLDWITTRAPLEISREVHLPDFDLSIADVKSCTAGYSTGDFPCIKADFLLERRIGYFLIQIYLPSILIVIISWVSFWIHSESAPARVALAITTVLTLTTHSATTTRAAMPRVSYITDMDIWMAACQTFVFAALLEYAIVNHISRQDKRLMKKLRQKKKNDPCSGAGGATSQLNGLHLSTSAVQSAQNQGDRCTPDVNSCAPVGGMQASEKKSCATDKLDTPINETPSTKAIENHHPTSAIASEPLTLSAEVSAKDQSLKTGKDQSLKTGNKEQSEECAPKALTSIPYPVKDYDVPEKEKETRVEILHTPKDKTSTQKNCESVRLMSELRLEAKRLAIRRSHAVDRASRIVFPLAFLIFNLFYWLYLYRILQ